MIRVLLILFLALPAGAAQWYAATNGVDGAAGTINAPWTLNYALTNLSGSHAVAGDTIWVRGGTYGLGTNPVYNVTITGTSSNAPIIVRNYNYEQASINGGFAHFTDGWVWFWGLEVYNSNTNRVSDSTVRVPGFFLLGHGDAVINCVIHDAGAQAIFYGAQVQGDSGFLYGNVAWGNGIYSLDPGFGGAPRGDGTYMQNTNGTRWITDMITTRNMNFGQKAYAEQSYANGFVFNGCVSFGNSAREMVVQGNHNQLTNIVVTNCFFFTDREASEPIRVGDVRVDPSSSQNNQNVLFANNIVADNAGTTFTYLNEMDYWSVLTMTNNTFIEFTKDAGNASSLAFWEIIPTNVVSYTINRNTYYGNGFNPAYDDWRYDNTRRTFAQVQGLGFEAQGSYITSLPVTNSVFLRTNLFEPGRANLIVYNPLSNNAVVVDLSGIGLTNGQMFKVRDVQNYFGTPALFSIYGMNGTSFSIPLNLTAITPLVGNVTNFNIPPTSHTPTIFNCFVITPWVGATNLAASCSQVDIQAAIAASQPGDTVIVPAGTCGPTVSILVTNQITLLHQGTVLQDSIIDNGDGANSSIYQVAVGPSPPVPTRITGATFVTGTQVKKRFDSGNIHLGGGATLVRLDHNNFNATLNIGLGGGDFFGVVDHNIFDAQGAFTQPVKFNHATIFGGQHGDNTWALPSWTNSYVEDGSAIYFEDNVWTNTSGVSGLGADSQGGARLVFRHEIADRIIFGGHGTDTTGRERGSRLKDVYNCLFVNHGDSEVGHWRSGSGMWASNTIVNSAGAFTIRAYRMLLGGFWGPASGTNVWDNNDPTIFATGTVGNGGALSMTDNTQNWTPNQWLNFTIRNVGSGRASVVQGNTATTITFSGSPDTSTSPDLVFVGGDTYQLRKIITVFDEPGRGMGTLISGSPPTPAAWANEAVDPIWCWGNTMNGAPISMNNGGYYPVVVGQEIRNETNTSWKPYIYPHPLVSGTNGPPPIPPQTPTRIARVNILRVGVTKAGP
jgi:hypothetical protein